MREGRSRSEWRREVLEYVVSRAQDKGSIRFVTDTPDGRREIDRLVKKLPDGFDAEVQKDGGVTYLSVSRRAVLPEAEPMFVVHYPETGTG